MEFPLWLRPSLLFCLLATLVSALCYCLKSRPKVSLTWSLRGPKHEGTTEPLWLSTRENSTLIFLMNWLTYTLEVLTALTKGILSAFWLGNRYLGRRICLNGFAFSHIASAPALQASPM